MSEMKEWPKNKRKKSSFCRNKRNKQKKPITKLRRSNKFKNKGRVKVKAKVKLADLEKDSKNDQYYAYFFKV